MASSGGDTYSTCIAQGRYDTVQPGEVCSIETAKRLGIYDAKSYYQPGNEGLKSFRAEVDGSERRYELCSQGKSGNEAYMACPVEHGMGFARKFGSADKCITFGCPPGFKAEGGKCKKPLADAVVSKRARCDERWYDWFMIPNYHLGNRVQGADGQCYAPCPEGHVPAYGTDPVDKSSGGLNAKDDLGQCLKREDYMHGKYAAGSEYCPIAWIHRVGALPSVFQRKMEAQVEEEKKKGIATEHMNALEAGLASQAEALAKEAGALMENVEPSTGEMVRACTDLHTQERLEDAYAVCEVLQNEPETLKNQMAHQLGEDEALLDQKAHVLRQACTAVFCNAETDAAGVLGKDPLCFPDTGTIDIVMKEDAETQKKAVNPADGVKRVQRAMGWMIKLIVLPIVAVMMFMVLSFVWTKLRAWWTGWSKSSAAEDILAVATQRKK